MLKFFQNIFKTFLNKRNLRKQERLIRKSKIFDEQFYQNKYGEEVQVNPIRHFLLQGASLGYKPCDWFDTGWYLEQNGDIAASQMNPLVHYILFGRAECRAPNIALQKAIEPYGLGEENDGVVDSLWSGYSALALAQLENIISDHSYDENIRVNAAWHSARWFYFTGNYDQALIMSNVVKSLKPSALTDKTMLLMHAFCLIKTDSVKQAKAYLLDFLKIYEDDADILFSLSNCYEDPTERLSLINRAYRIHGFAEIMLPPAGDNLTFQSIRTDTVGHRDARLISIIMPCYNAEDSIEVAIRSLLNQTWQNLEVIVVDDCSSDRTIDIVKRLSNQDGRVKLIQQEINGGAYRARNAGLRSARGDFLATHDSDDWSHPEKLESQIAFLDINDNVMGVCTHWIRANHDLHFQHNWRLNPRLIHWSHSSFLFRRKVFDDLGYWDAVIVGGDSEFIWRVEARYGLHSVNRIHSEIPLAFALDDEGSLTRHKATHIRTMYHGVRHIYRSACQWWHLHSDTRLHKTDTETRVFPAPQTVVNRDDSRVTCDILFIADYSQSHQYDDDFGVMRELLNRGKTIVLYHIPKYGQPQVPLADKFFEVLTHDNASVCVYGMEVVAIQTVFLSVDLFDAVPEQLVSINTSTVTVKNSLNSSHALGRVEGYFLKNLPETVKAVEKIEMSNLLLSQS